MPTSDNSEAAEPKKTTVISQHLSKLRISKPGKSKKEEGGSNKNSESGSKVAAEEPLNPEDIKLPQTFQVKYLGKRDARGLWGIKHTRKPVDEMVAAARNVKAGNPLPFLHLHVTDRGVKIEPSKQNLNASFDSGPFPIDSISYGVQDLVYTRVFAMIVVREGQQTVSAAAPEFRNPFECYGFVCDSRQNARRLTFALAKAFQDFSKTVKAEGGGGGGEQRRKPKQFAIDLRTPEQIEEDLRLEADSEA